MIDDQLELNLDGYNQLLSSNQINPDPVIVIGVSSTTTPIINTGGVSINNSGVMNNGGAIYYTGSTIASTYYIPCSIAASEETDTVADPIASNGCSCARCKEFNEYAEPNQPNNTFVCYACREIWK